MQRTWLLSLVCGCSAALAPAAAHAQSADTRRARGHRVRRQRRRVAQRTGGRDEQ